MKIISGLVWKSSISIQKCFTLNFSKAFDILRLWIIVLIIFFLQIPVKSRNSLCPAVGFHEFESAACSPNFLRCQKSIGKRMEGFIYQCPEGFAYWPVSRRCERTSKLLDCQSSKQFRTKWRIPIETTNISYRRRKSLSLV